MIIQNKNLRLNRQLIFLEFFLLLNATATSFVILFSFLLICPGGIVSEIKRQKTHLMI